MGGSPSTIVWARDHQFVKSLVGLKSMPTPTQPRCLWRPSRALATFCAAVAAFLELAVFGATAAVWGATLAPGFHWSHVVEGLYASQPSG